MCFRVFVIALGVFFVGCRQSSLEAVGQPAAAPQGTVRISAKEFQAERDGKLEPAQNKYLGKTIEIEGTVALVGRNSQQVPYFTLESGSLLGLQCFPDDQNIFGEVVPGQHVVLLANINEFALSVAINECKIVELGPSPAITFDASELAREWATDTGATNNKLNGRMLIITGEVDEKQAEQTGAVLYLRTGEKTRVACSFGEFEKDLFNKIGVNEKVTLVGEFQEFPTRPHDGPTVGACLPVSK